MALLLPKHAGTNFSAINPTDALPANLCKRHSEKKATYFMLCVCVVCFICLLVRPEGSINVLLLLLTPNIICILLL